MAASHSRLFQVSGVMWMTMPCGLTLRIRLTSTLVVMAVFTRAGTVATPGDIFAISRLHSSIVYSPITWSRFITSVGGHRTTIRFVDRREPPMSTALLTPIGMLFWVATATNLSLILRTQIPFMRNTSMADLRAMTDAHRSEFISHRTRRAARMITSGTGIRRYW